MSAKEDKVDGDWDQSSKKEGSKNDAGIVETGENLNKPGAGTWLIMQKQVHDIVIVKGHFGSQRRGEEGVKKKKKKLMRQGGGTG